jgi:hypothetical protein
VTAVWRVSVAFGSVGYLEAVIGSVSSTNVEETEPVA